MGLDTFVANWSGAEYRLDKRVEGEVVEGDDADVKCCCRVAWGCTSGSFRTDKGGLATDFVTVALSAGAH